MPRPLGSVHACPCLQQASQGIVSRRPECGTWPHATLSPGSCPTFCAGVGAPTSSSFQWRLQAVWAVRSAVPPTCGRQDELQKSSPVSLFCSREYIVTRARQAPGLAYTRWRSAETNCSYAEDARRDTSTMRQVAAAFVVASRAISTVRQWRIKSPTMAFRST